jgi:glutaminase
MPGGTLMQSLAVHLLDLSPIVRRFVRVFSAQTESDRPYVSTGHWPAPDLVETLVAEAHAKYKSNTEGKNSQVYPALARVPASLFGICVVETNYR